MLKLEDLPPKAQAQAAKQMKGGAPKPSKYYNRKATRQTPDGRIITFDSQKEARRYDELMALLKAGKIKDLKLQPQFTLQEAYTTPEGVRVQAMRYQADFEYCRPAEAEELGNGYWEYFARYFKENSGGVTWFRVVEDVKSPATKTRVYEMKKKLLRERLGIEITEV